MPAFLSWVDSSSADRERMRRAIELLSERDTRDELGLGTIRDAFADAFFPGTSTVETRLRYCLFVPWIYRELERARVSAADLPQRLRKLETDLIFVLLAADEHDGTIGARAKRNIQRLPSSVYWATMQRWGICRFAGSQDQLHRHFDAVRRRGRRAMLPDDEGARTAAESTWHPRLPAPPPGWPNEADFVLRLEESEFLRGRILATCEHTVLAELAAHARPSDVAYPWLHPSLGTLPVRLRTELDLARRFSLVVHGAALLYNLMLSEQAERDDWVELHGDALARWSTSDEAADLRGFDLVELWGFVEEQRANVPQRTRQFIHDWVRMLDEADPTRLADHEEARVLIRRREGTLKGTRSRFTNRRALDQWGGSSGAGRLEYRWRVTQRLLNDLLAGLDEAED